MKETTLLFVHGGPAMDDSYFRPYFDSLSSQYELIFYRQKRKPSNGVADLVEELVGHICSQNGPVFVVAHSWGTVLALETIARTPDLKIDGLILISAIMDPSYEKLSQEARGSMVPWTEGQGIETFKSGTVSAVPLFFQPSFWNEGARVWERIDFCPETFRILHDSFNKTADHREVVRDLQMPVLNIFGTSDFRVPAAHSEALRSVNPRIENVPIPDAGHFPFVEKPKQVIDCIDRFVKRQIKNSLS